jgi:hypothetical protein
MRAGFRLLSCKEKKNIMKRSIKLMEAIIETSTLLMYQPLGTLYNIRHALPGNDTEITLKFQICSRTGYAYGRIY